MVEIEYVEPSESAALVPSTLTGLAFGKGIRTHGLYIENTTSSIKRSDPTKSTF
jgi:hypothetical protein